MMTIKLVQPDDAYENAAHEFYIKLRKLIDRQQGLTIIEAIGILHIMLAELIHTMQNFDDDEE